MLPGMFEYRIVTSGPGAWGGGGRVGAGRIPWDFRGNHGGRPKVLDEDDVLFARALRDKGTPMPDIVKKLTIKTGKNAGQHPPLHSS